MSGNEKDDGEEGRFELTEIQLSKDASGENNTSCASTLYDPSILALSTDHQAILEARYGRHNKYEEDSEKINAPFHIQSPSQRPSNSSPFGLHVNSASKTPYSSYSYGNEEGEESRTCCWGCLPLYASLIVVNIFNTVRLLHLFLC